VIPTPSSLTNNTKKERKQRLLTTKMSPADILQNTLLGLGEDDDDDNHEDDTTTVEESSDNGRPTNDPQPQLWRRQLSTH